MELLEMSEERVVQPVPDKRFLLRLPIPLYAAIEGLSQSERRSVNAQIVVMLEQCLPYWTKVEKR